MAQNDGKKNQGQGDAALVRSGGSLRPAAEGRSVRGAVRDGRLGPPIRSPHRRPCWTRPPMSPPKRSPTWVELHPVDPEPDFELPDIPEPVFAATPAAPAAVIAKASPEMPGWARSAYWIAVPAAVLWAGVMAAFASGYQNPFGTVRISAVSRRGFRRPVPAPRRVHPFGGLCGAPGGQAVDRDAPGAASWPATSPFPPPSPPIRLAAPQRPCASRWSGRPQPPPPPNNSSSASAAPWPRRAIGWWRRPATPNAAPTT